MRLKKPLTIAAAVSGLAGVAGAILLGWQHRQAQRKHDILYRALTLQLAATRAGYQNSVRHALLESVGVDDARHMLFSLEPFTIGEGTQHCHATAQPDPAFDTLRVTVTGHVTVLDQLCHRLRSAGEASPNVTIGESVRFRDAADFGPQAYFSLILWAYAERDEEILALREKLEGKGNNPLA